MKNNFKRRMAAFTISAAMVVSSGVGYIQLSERSILALAQNKEQTEEITQQTTFESVTPSEGINKKSDVISEVQNESDITEHVDKNTNVTESTNNKTNESDLNENNNWEDYSDKDYLFNQNAGKLIINNESGMNTFVNDEYINKNNVKFIEFKSGITQIPAKVLDNYPHVVNIKIPDTVINIEDDTFQLCKALERIDVDENNSVYSSDDGILFNAEKTRLIRVPSARIGTSYSIPVGVIKIDDNALYETSQITEVTIPDSTEEIGNYAFSSSSIKAIIVPDTVKKIGEGAFSMCRDLQNVKLSSSIQRISKNLFQGCNSLVNISIPNGVVNIDSNAFSNCTRLKIVNIPASVEILNEDNIFNDCSSLTEINIDENNIKYKSLNGILYNKNMDSLLTYPSGKRELNFEIPTSVNSIYSEAFSFNTSIREITVPASVSSIENGAFNYCKNLSKVTFLGNYAPTTNGCLFENAEQGIILNVPKGGIGYDRGDYIHHNITIMEVNKIKPEVPKRFAVAATSKNSITVTWERIANADKYYIYRSNEENGNYLQVGWVNAKDNSFIDSPLEQNTNCYYRIASAKIADGVEILSEQSEQIYAQTKTDLKAPISFRISGSDTKSIILQWDKSIPVDRYYIYRSESEYGEYEEIYWLSGDKTEYVDINVIPNHEYFYKIKAARKKGTDFEFSEFTEAIKASASLSVGIPENFKVTGCNKNSVELSWDRLTSADRYYIYLSNTDNGEKVQIAVLNGNQTKFKAENLISDKYHYFTIKAARVSGSNLVYSEDTEPVVAKTLLDWNAPNNMSVYMSDSNSIKLVWGKVQNANRYYIYRRNKDETYFKYVGWVNGNTNTFTDKTVELGQNYEYSIRGAIVNDSDISYTEFAPALSARAKNYWKSPTGVRINNITYGSIRISFNKVAGSECYALYKAYKKDGPYEYVGSVNGNTNYIDYFEIDTNTNYYFKIAAGKMIDGKIVYNNLKDCRTLYVRSLSQY